MTDQTPAPKATVAPSELAPTSATERVETLDILRGFALFGVLLVNMEGFVAPSFSKIFAGDGALSAVNHYCDWIVRIFSGDEFNMLFAFLFGYGLALQMGRAANQDARFSLFAARRLAVLFIIGLFHALLFWAGDILHTFSAIAFILLAFFCKRRDRTLIIWTCLLFVMPALCMTGLCTLVAKAETKPRLAAKLDQFEHENRLQMEAVAEQKVEIYRHGSFRDILARRWLDLKGFWGMLPLTGPIVLGTMIIGFMAGRSRLLHDTAARAPALRRLLLLAIPAGFAIKIAYLLAMENLSLVRITWWWDLAAFTAPWAALGIATTYTSIVSLAALRPLGHKLLAPLAAVGRTTLTNYLAQSVICTTLMLSYGLGLYGHIRPLAALGLTVAIFLIQIWISIWWLRRFRFGPAEWLWRMASYGRRLPMRPTTSSE